MKQEALVSVLNAWDTVTCLLRRRNVVSWNDGLGPERGESRMHGELE
jgi:hypothetical protein